jgi:hypothetical protein
MKIIGAKGRFVGISESQENEKYRFSQRQSMPVHSRNYAEKI